MPEKDNRAEQLSLLTPAELVKLKVERRPSQTRTREAETAAGARREVRKPHLTEDSALQERLPGIVWPTK